MAEVQGKPRRERRTTPANLKIRQATFRCDPIADEDAVPSPELPPKTCRPPPSQLNPHDEGKQDHRLSESYDSCSKYKSPRRSELFVELPSQSELNDMLSAWLPSQSEVCDKPTRQSELSSQSERYVMPPSRSEVSPPKQPELNGKPGKPQHCDRSSSRSKVCDSPPPQHDRLPSQSGLCDALDLYESVPGNTIDDAMFEVNGVPITEGDYESIHTDPGNSGKSSFARQALASKVPGLKISRSCDLLAPYESISHNILSDLASILPTYTSFSSALGSKSRPVSLLVSQFESLSRADPKQTSDTKAGHRRKLSFDSHTDTPAHTVVREASQGGEIAVD